MLNFAIAKKVLLRLTFPLRQENLPLESGCRNFVLPSSLGGNIVLIEKQ